MLFSVAILSRGSVSMMAIEHGKEIADDNKKGYDPSPGGEPQPAAVGALGHERPWGDDAAHCPRRLPVRRAFPGAGGNQRRGRLRPTKPPGGQADSRPTRDQVPETAGGQRSAVSEPRAGWHRAGANRHGHLRAEQPGGSETGGVLRDQGRGAPLAVVRRRPPRLHVGPPGGIHPSDRPDRGSLPTPPLRGRSAGGGSPGCGPPAGRSRGGTRR